VEAGGDVADRVQGDDRARFKPSWQAVVGDAREIVSDLTRFNEPHRAQRLQDHADAMFTDLVHLGEAMLVTADHLARLLPGYRTATRQVRRAEVAVLRDVKRRIDEVAAPEVGEGVDPRPQLLERLMQASMETNPRRSLELLHLRILRELLPDEARILAALSDGTRFALIHIYVRGGGGVRTALENASTVGRVAAVHVNQAVPLYLSHLRELGLAEEGPAEELLSDQYALLTSEDYVQRAIAEAEGGLRGSRVVRRTLRISRLGTELWTACTGQGVLRRVPSPGQPDEIYLSAYAGAPPRATGEVTQ
jgi:hypothetical protein